MLYTPWREEFVLGPRDQECIFCEPEKRKHVRELILHRGKRAFVVLNRYPYNTGHLMVVPYRHIAQLDDLTFIAIWTNRFAHTPFFATIVANQYMGTVAVSTITLVF